MSKAIKHIRTLAFIIVVVQVVILAAFSVVYFNNLFQLKDNLPELYIILGAVVLVAINCLFVWLTTLRISRLRQKTDLHAAEVIGSDIQEAYNFAMLGLAVTDDNDVVLWTNDLFKDRHLNIIDLKITEWLPDLKKLRESNNSNAEIKVDINSRDYVVKLLPEAGLWIFKDDTDFENLYEENQKQAPVVGILTIDNYADATHGEAEDLNDAVTKVKNKIFEYAKKFAILLRKFKEDSYFMLCNYESLVKMRADNFSIIDEVRKIGYEENTSLTLSIGIAHNFPDVNKLNDLAFEALDIAMSRGGDQVVLSVYGKDMEFIGGKTEAQEKRNRVKIRVLADSLLGLIKNASNVLIMGHSNADMDAIGACLGIHAICKRLKKAARIVVDLKSTETKTRAAFTSSFSRDELDEIRITPKDANDTIGPDTLLVVVDVHTPYMTMAPDLVNKASKIVVIDHHRRAEQYIDMPVLNHIDPSASSACELVTEFIKFASINPRINLPQAYATIMLSGIFLDSGYFRSKQTGIRTFEACTVLKEYGADNSLADDFLKDEMEEYFVVSGMVKNMKFHSPGVAYVCADPNIEYDQATIAKVANTVLSMKGVRASFVIGKVDKEVKVSCRSDSSISVQLLAEKLGGGGHLAMAAASFKNKTINQVEQLLLSVLDTYLNAARNDARTRIITEEDAA